MENHVIKLRPAVIPSVNVALMNYESHGGHLIRPERVPFGQDPLANILHYNKDVNISYFSSFHWIQCFVTVLIKILMLWLGVSYTLFT